jgi:hypothetical protein
LANTNEVTVTESDKAQTESPQPLPVTASTLPPTQMSLNPESIKLLSGIYDESVQKPHSPQTSLHKERYAETKTAVTTGISFFV